MGEKKTEINNTVVTTGVTNIGDGTVVMNGCAVGDGATIVTSNED